MTHKHDSLKRESAQVRRLTSKGLVVGAAFLLGGALTTLAVPSGASTVSAKADGASAVSRSTTSLAGVSYPTAIKPAAARNHQARVIPLLRPHGGTAQAKLAPVVPSAPAPAGLKSAVKGRGVIHNFDGIDAIQNKATAGFDLEPPDEGLGAGNGYVVNFVNVTGAVYRNDGSTVAGPFYLNTFFNEPANTNTSDPRVFYDASSHTWFGTILEYQFTSGGTVSESHVDIAVSASANPAGMWRVYRLPTSDTNHAGCPCLADYPIMGVDKHNVYISTNEFTANLNGFNGTQVYAVSKSQLVAGRSSVNVVQFQNLSVAGTAAYHVQPANTYGAAAAEWMMSSLDPNGTNDHRLAVWAITNQRSVTTGHGTPTLSVRVVQSNTYSLPPNAQTPPGFCSGSACGSGGAPTTGVVQTDFDAMQEVQYIQGKLVGALNTGVTVPGDPVERSGVLWVVVHPYVQGASVSARTHVSRQGYIAERGEYLLYPHINMTGNGSMAMVFGLGGPTTFLSTAYTTTAPGMGFQQVYLAGAGTGPDNGFTGTQQFGGAGRWGDYSNGQIIPGTRKVWLASQYIPNSGDGNANWGNRIFELKLS
ncbi:MAG: hypothetical protein ACR2KG_08095 [Nocardioidaceae bacterium]